MPLFFVCLLNKTFTVIWYLKPLTSSYKFLNKYLMHDSLASYCDKESVESIISIL